MDDSLQGAIDPALQDPEPQGQTVPSSQDADAPAMDAEPATWERSRKQRKPPKEPEQVFRRKEANRLAAERSRIRAKEKGAALSVTHDRVEAENRALKAELIALGVHDFGDPDAWPGGDTGAEGAGDVSQSGEDENHSRNILAALMKDAGIHVEEGDEASWMQGVENFIKEAETNGRLGDLAAVAADSKGDQGEQAGGSSGQAGGTVADAPAQTVGSESASGAGKEVAKTLGYSAQGASEATLSALAVALNAEIERVFRDEYAATKTAILQVEQQLAEAAGGSARDEEVTLSISGTPATVSLEDIENSQSQTLASIESLKAQMPQVRATMFHAEEAKVHEENKLAAVVEQVLAVRARAEESKKTRIEDELRAVLGYVGSLLSSILAGGDAENHRKAHLLDTPLSSPALAHRKRGRPRKGSTPLVYQQSAHYRSDPNAGGSPAQISPGSASRSTRRRGRPSAGSKLRESISAASLNAAAVQESLAADAKHEGDGEQKLEEIDLEGLAGVEDGEEREADELLGGGSAEGSPVSVLSRFKKGEPGSCSLCGRTETSAWRKVIVNGEALRVCNACGLYHSKFGVLRPSDLWGDGKGIRKRRSTRGGGGDEDELDETPRKRTRGKAKQVVADAADEDDDAQFEGINDLEGITEDMVAEAVATAQAESARATPGGGEPAGAEPEDSGEIVVDEDLQKSFEQLTRHLEQQSRSGSGSLSADVFNV